MKNRMQNGQIVIFMRKQVTKKVKRKALYHSVLEF